MELGKWSAMETIVGSAEHPAKEIPKVGEALTSSHVAQWYVLRARYRAEQGLLEYAGYDCDYVGNLAARIGMREDRDKVMLEMDGVRERIREIKLALDRRAGGGARGRRAMRGRH